MLCDVSNFPYDELGLSAATVKLSWKCWMEANWSFRAVIRKRQDLFREGSRSFEKGDEKSYQQDTMEFQGMINISKISGIYIEDLYVPVR